MILTVPSFCILHSEFCIPRPSVNLKSAIFNLQS